MPPHMRSASILLASLCSILIGCDPATMESPDAGVIETPQGSPARGALIINEVAPRPESSADWPDWPDWIELYNRGSEPVDLCGYFVTDSLDRLDHYAPLGGIAPPAPCTPSLLEPGAYFIVYADDAAQPGPAHAPFKLGTAEEVHIVSTQGIAQDSLIYLYPQDLRGASLARQPNGDGLFYLAAPSPGAQNQAPAAPSSTEILP